MHTKGTVSKYFQDKLNLDCCIYLGNDLNDIPMFSQGLGHGDYVVVAQNPDHKITDMIFDYLKSECTAKGIPWSETNLLFLKRENANKFLKSINKILKTVYRSRTRHHEDEQI